MLAVSVGIKVEVAVGGSFVAVFVGGIAVAACVAVCVAVEVAVGKSGTIVTPGIGVRVGMLGTQSLCPV